MSNFIAGLALALVLSLIIFRLPLKRALRVSVIWLALFVVQEFSNLVEGLFFTTFLPTISLFFAASLIGLVVTFVEALLAGILWVPGTPVKPFSKEIKVYFEGNSWSSWVARIALASLLYFPIYFTFGAMISPFVIPYYQNSSLGLTIPSFTVIIPLEFARGFLYVAALLPIIALMKASRKYVYAGTAGLLYIAGAFVPFLTSNVLPIQLRIFHGLEILGDCIVYGAVLVLLLGQEKSVD